MSSSLDVALSAVAPQLGSVPGPARGRLRPPRPHRRLRQPGLCRQPSGPRSRPRRPASCPRSFLPWCPRALPSHRTACRPFTAWLHGSIMAGGHRGQHGKMALLRGRYGKDARTAMDEANDLSAAAGFGRFSPWCARGSWLRSPRAPRRCSAAPGKPSDKARTCWWSRPRARARPWPRSCSPSTSSCRRRRQQADARARKKEPTTWASRTNRTDRASWTDARARRACACCTCRRSRRWARTWSATCRSHLRA